MWNRSEHISIVDKGLTVDGTISSKGRLIIKGVVKGTLVGETVIIAEEGAVYADVKVASMTIGGRFEGEIKASDELIILSTGNCAGKIVCKDFVVEAGGVLNAEITSIAVHNSKSGKDLTAPAKKSFTVKT